MSSRRITRKLEENLLAVSVDFYSKEVDLEDNSGFSVQVRTENESSFSCDLELEVSNDRTNWIAVTGTSTSLTGDDLQFYDAIQSSACYARVSITNISGSADFDLDWVIK